jgi:L-threonylcarbamoyladenylate synthase
VTHPRGLATLVGEAIAAGDIPGVLAVSEALAELGPPGRGASVVVEDLGPTGDDEEVARRLFAAMRRLDQSGATMLFACTVPPRGRGAAVNDRLKRAASRIV